MKLLTQLILLSALLFTTSAQATTQQYTINNAIYDMPWCTNSMNTALAHNGRDADLTFITSIDQAFETGLEWTTLYHSYQFIWLTNPTNQEKIGCQMIIVFTPPVGEEPIITPSSISTP